MNWIPRHSHPKIYSSLWRPRHSIPKAWAAEEEIPRQDVLPMWMEDRMPFNRISDENAVELENINGFLPNVVHSFCALVPDYGYVEIPKRCQICREVNPDCYHSELMHRMDGFFNHDPYHLFHSKCLDEQPVRITQDCYQDHLYIQCKNDKCHDHKMSFNPMYKQYEDPRNAAGDLKYKTNRQKLNKMITVVNTCTVKNWHWFDYMELRRRSCALLYQVIYEIINEVDYED